MSSPTTADRARFGAKALTIVLVTAVGLLLLPFISGLMGAGILYVVAEPLLRRLARSNARRLAAFFTVFALFFVLVLPGAWLFTQLLVQVPDAVRELQSSTAFRNLMTLRIGDLDVGAQLQLAMSDVVRWSSRQTLALLGGMMSAAVNLVIALFGTYYLLMGGEWMWDQSKRLLPFCPTTAEVLRVRFHLVTEAMLLGVVVTGAAQGTLVALALAVLGIDHALFWGAATAACSVIPMFGSGIIWVPASVFLLASNRMGAAIALVLFGGLVVSNVDNMLRLFVYKRVSHVHPMVTLVGAFAGMRAFGTAGLLIGPLLLSYAIELVRVVSPSDPLVEAPAA